MDTPIRLEVDGAIGIVTLDDPETRNAMSNACAKGLRHHLRSVESSDEVRIVIITGAHGVFSSGANMKDRTVHSAGRLTERNPSRQTQIFDMIAECGKPTIAAINGPAVGAGANLALACDLRVCAENAWMQWPQVSFGIMPGSGTVARLSHVAGTARTLDWTMTGRRVDAAEGLATGLHVRVAPEAELLTACRELAELISSHPAGSVRFVREAVASLVKRDVAFTADADAYRSYILYNSRERQKAAQRWLDERAAQVGGEAVDGEG